jgi:very-short-patch-repair endonuclease
VPLAACARIAAAQHGVISRAQASATGLSLDSIDRLIRGGAWSKRHRGVYALWVAEERWLQRLMAGCLWLGAASGVSHRAAAVLLGLEGFDAAPLEFSTRGRCRPRGRSAEGPLLVHEARSLRDADIQVHKGIPVTSATRTLIDLGAVANPREIELALESALRRGLTSSTRLLQRLAEFPPRTLKHAHALRGLLRQRPAVGTESALETLVWRLLLDEGLPPPVRQHVVLGLDGHSVARVDFAYPREKVAIEADGYEFHSSPEDWHRDRRRQNALTTLGWTVYRVTWPDAIRRPRAVARQVADLLAGRSKP